MECGGVVIFAQKLDDMKKRVLVLFCAVIALVCSCSKKDVNDVPDDKASWTTLVKEYAFLDGFPVFDGEVENCQYREIAGMETVTFFDYDCAESVPTTYYAKFAPAGFTKSEGSQIYRKTVGDKVYTFTGGYSAKNFALSFSVDTK